MSQTRVFVSSTCYDLIHLRGALNNHISSLGHLPVMSEFTSFQVDPQLSALENCRNNVRNNADIFVLIVGGRRGSVHEPSGKSIVNLEYEAAVQEGLDIYVFVDQSVVALLPVWHKNKEADLSPAVDSNLVFEFVAKIREEQRWTFPFSKEADIFEILTEQLTNQLRELLAKRRAGTLPLTALFREESQRAIALLNSREPFWEYLVSAELLERRLVRARKQLNNIRRGVVLGPHKSLKGRAYMNWVTNKFPELSCTLTKVTSVFEEDIMQSWGPPGISGNPKEMLDAANELQAALTALIEIESDIFRTHGPDAAEPVRRALLGVTEDVIGPIETLPQRLLELVEKARLHKPGDEPLSMNLNLKFEYTGAERFTSALAHMRSNVGPDEWE